MDKDKLLAPRLPEGTVELDLGTVRVRGLSRGEVFGIQQIKGVQAQERKQFALALLDPVMNEDDVKQWQENSPAGEMEPVADKIRELSGIGEGADKSGVPGSGGGAGSGVRDVPGAEAGDDGGPAAGADEQ